MDDGWADVAAGLKLSLWTDVETQTLLSAGFTYEIPMGQTRALQGNGDGEFNLFLTGGAELIDDIHYVSALGVRLPADRGEENQVMYWSNHFDRRLGDSGLYVFSEWNWYHWLADAGTFPLPFGGLDVINLGATGVAHQDVVTTALGVKYKPQDNVEIGLCYEIPVTQKKDILQDRIGFDLIVRY